MPYLNLDDGFSEHRKVDEQVSARCAVCGWPTPTGSCGRCSNEAREALRAYNANHCPDCSDFRPCGASWVSPAGWMNEDAES